MVSINCAITIVEYALAFMLPVFQLTPTPCITCCNWT